MNYYVYILYSESLKRYYVGCSKFRGKRLRQHLSGQSNWTSRTQDWKEVYYQEIPNREAAFRLEKQIKKRGAKRFLADLASHGDVLANNRTISHSKLSQF